MESLTNEFKLLKKQQQLKDISNRNIDVNSPDLLKALLPLYEPNAKMLAWHSAKQTHKGIKGGKRSGKTTALEAEAIKLSYINKPLFHLSLSPSFDNACETVVVVLEDHCIKNGLTYEWQISKNLFRIVWGKKKSDIANILIHGKDSAYDGVTAASGDLNEPFLIDENSFLVWWERISDPRAKYMCRTWGGTANPKKMQWGWDYFKQAKYDDPDFYADTITTYDNRHLSEDYIKGLEKRYSPKQREVYMMGGCIRLVSGEAVYEDFTDKNTFNPLTFKLDYSTVPFSELVLGYDFNVKQMSAGLHELSGKWKLKREEYRIKGRSNTRELTNMLVSKMIEKGYLIKFDDGCYWTKFHTSLLLTGDATGESGSSQSNLSDYQQIVRILESWNIRFHPIILKKNPPVRDRTNYINEEFYSGNYLISEECPVAIRDRELTVWKVGARGYEIDKANKELTHMSDADDYGVYNTRILSDSIKDGDGENDGENNSVKVSTRDR